MEHEIREDENLMATNHWVADSRPMGIGLMMPISEEAAFGGTPQFTDIVEMAQGARDIGIDTLWFADHLTFGTPEDGQRGVWEAFTLMAAVAARVPDVKIGALVACTGYRNPGIIAKMTEMIDEISDGRFILGLGAGWHQPVRPRLKENFSPRRMPSTSRVVLDLPVRRFSWGPAAIECSASSRSMPTPGIRSGTRTWTL
jgi:hypothetical protein